MSAAMACFAVEDALLKAATRQMPVGQVLMIFGAVGTIGFALLAAARGQALMPRAARSGAIIARAGFETGARVFHTFAIALTPLSLASAILQAAPLVVVAGAALVFGERVGWRRWLAVLAGLAGVLVILRPGLEGFTPAALLAVLGMLGFAGRDLATRAAPRQIGSFTLAAYGFAAIIPAGALIMALGEAPAPPAPGALARIGAAALVGGAGYWAITVAMRMGEVSAVAPFRYARLVFAMLLGVAVFGETPDAATLLGSAVVVGAGLYALAAPAPRRFSRPPAGADGADAGG
ncbi:MAG: DMT family transporter [Alphaproteobacteria bacterium]|nr:MAG: DMT family transporter [Alphaproteobacteria bacterium]